MGKIIHEAEAYAGFERIQRAGLDPLDVLLFCFQRMPDHWHLVLLPDADGKLGQLLR